MAPCNGESHSPRGISWLLPAGLRQVLCAAWGFAQGFQRDIEIDLVSAFEAIDHSFGDRLNAGGTPSIRWVCRPNVSEHSKIRTARSGERLVVGRRFFSSIAIQTLNMLCVPMSLNRSAESRHTTPLSTRFDASAIMRTSVMEACAAV